MVTIAMPSDTVAESELLSSTRNVSSFSTSLSENIATNLQLSSPGDDPAPNDPVIGELE